MSSAYFTAPRPNTRQIEIPMGSHHVCPECGNSWICDQGDCRLPLKQDCPGANALPHSQRPENETVIARSDIEQGALW